MLGQSLIRASAAGELLFWIATLGGNDSDFGSGIAVDNNGNVYVVGSAVIQDSGSYDLLIAKYNTNGVIQWQRSLGGDSADLGQGIAVDNNGNVYVAGYTNSQDPGSYDLLIAKYNTNGVIQWQRLLGGNDTDSGQGIAVDNNGNVYVVGTTDVQDSGPYGSNYLLIAKYNTNGVIQWQRSLGGDSADLGQGIAVDNNGNVYVVGITYNQGSGSYGSSDLLIAKYNTNGEIQWQRLLGGNYSDSGYGIAVDNSGNVYVSGHIDEGGSGFDDLLVAKYNTDGVIQWHRSLGGNYSEDGNGIAVDNNGNVYVVGETYNQGSGSYDLLIAKYNTNGVIQWQRLLGGNSSDLGYGIAVDNNGNVYVVGNTGSQGSGQSDLLIAKLPSGGSLTGTYGSLTYSTTTLLDSTTTLTDSLITLTDSTTTLTDLALNLSGTNSTLTSTTVIL